MKTTSFIFCSFSVSNYKNIELILPSNGDIAPAIAIRDTCV